MSRWTFALAAALLAAGVAAGEDVWDVQVNQREAVDVARDGRYVYLATGGGVLRLDVETSALTPILPLQGLASVQVSAVAADRRGNKWFGHSDPDLGVSLLDSAGNWSLISSFEGLQLGPGKKVNTVYALGDSVWIGTESGATLYEDRVRKIILSQDKEGIISDYINAVLSIGNSVWLGTNAGLSVYRTGTVRNFTVQADSLPSPDVLCLAADSEGRVWGGTARGLFYVEGDEIVRPDEFVPLERRRIRSIAFEDSSGTDVPWFATDNGPYRRLSRKANKESGTPIGDPEESRKVLVDEEGDIWLANGKRWMFRWVPVADGWREYRQSSTIPFNHIGDVAVDKAGLVWCALVGNVEGAANSPGSRMMVWNALTWNLVGSAALPDSYAAIVSVAIDSLGNRWFGAREGGVRPRGTLLKIAGSVGSVVGAGDIEFFPVNAPDFAEQTRAINSVEVGPDNTKWVAVTNEGCAALDASENRNAWGGWSLEHGTNEPECFVSEQTTLPNSAIDVAVAPDGRVWCALERSLATAIDYNGTLTIKNDDDCLRFTDRNSPMPGNQYTVRADGDGVIWFGSAGGLSRYDPGDDSWKVFTVQNTGGGLPDNRVRAIAFDRLGNAWIGTFGGGLAVLLADGRTWLEPWTVEGNQRRGSGLTTNDITSLFVHVNEQNEEEVWIATWGGGLIRFVKDWSDLPIIEEQTEIPPVLAYPNPYRQGEESVDVIGFAGAPAGSMIEIYTVTGDRIRTIPGPASEDAPNPTWDLENEDRVGVASGVYVFLVKQKGEVVQTGKLAYLR